nr:nuclear transport factor 2 family protein [Nocardia donostiensis]
MPDITAEDLIAIHETIALHGHLADDREWDRLGEVFAADVVFDVTDYGYGTCTDYKPCRTWYAAAGTRRTNRWHITSPTSSSPARTTGTRGCARRDWRSRPTEQPRPRYTKTSSNADNKDGASSTAK